jgi:hypothetical protein
MSGLEDVRAQINENDFSTKQLLVLLVQETRGVRDEMHNLSGRVRSLEDYRLVAETKNDFGAAFEEAGVTTKRWLVTALFTVAGLSVSAVTLLLKVHPTF